MANDEFCEPPQRADFKNPVFIFCRLLGPGHQDFGGGGSPEDCVNPPPPPFLSRKPAHPCTIQKRASVRRSPLHSIRLVQRPTGLWSRPHIFTAGALARWRHCPHRLGCHLCRRRPRTCGVVPPGSYVWECQPGVAAPQKGWGLSPPHALPLPAWPYPPTQPSFPLGPCAK